jgi:hypothetical protein
MKCFTTQRNSIKYLVATRSQRKARALLRSKDLGTREAPLWAKEDQVYALIDGDWIEW